MKLKIVLSLITCFASIAIFAKNVRTIKNYEHVTQVSVKNLAAIISIDGASKTFELVSSNNLLNIKNANDALVFMQLNPENQASLKLQYDTISAGKYASLSLINQIINRAKEIGDIEFSDKNSTTVGSLQVVSEPNNIAAEMPTDVQNPNLQNEYTPSKTEVGFMDKLLPLLTAFLVALGLGVVIGKKLFSNTVSVEIDSDSNVAEAENTTVKNETGTIITKAAKRQVNITQLKKINQDCVAEIKQLKIVLKNVDLQNTNASKQLQDVQQSQKILFDAVQSKLVTPFISAVDQNNISAISATSLKGMAYLISITRAAKGLQQEYDNQNLNALKHETKINATQISNQTFADDIPKNIKSIMELMQKNGVAEIKDVSFFGYSINKV